MDNSNAGTPASGSPADENDSRGAAVSESDTVLTEIWNSLGSEPKRNGVTPHQERIRALIENTDDYHELHRKLQEEVAFFKAEIPKLDSRPEIEAFREVFDMERAQYAAERELENPEPFYEDTVIEFDVPSGFLVIRDSLHPIFTPFVVGRMRQGLELHQMAVNYAADFNVASASVGNSCPDIVQKEDGSYVVVSPEFDDENESSIYKADETPLLTVDTSSWSVEICDYQHWLDHGGAILHSAVDGLLEVTPGRYRWVAKCHKDGWSHYDFPRAEFATLTLIEPLSSERS